MGKIPNNPFEDNLEFMAACGKPIPEQPTLDYPSEEMQWGLIEEEFKETELARARGDIVEVLDGLVDILKVTIEYGESCGFDMQAAWDEVHRSNMSKVIDGKVIRREDGKILKPESYIRPDLTAIATKRKKRD